jgi:hypothetical protein
VPRLRRLRALSVADKIGVAGLALTIITVIGIPLGNPLWHAWFGGEGLTLSIAPVDDPCDTRWILSSGNEDLKPRLHEATEQQFTRWTGEGRIVQLDQAVAEISLYGAGDHAVQLQDMTFTVTRRAAPVRGEKLRPPDGCGSGGSDQPGAVAVNLDAIAVGRTVSLNTLKASPRQRKTKATAEQYGDPLALPSTLTDHDYYTIYVIGLTAHYDCSWKAILTWWDGGKQHRTTVDDHGTDFRVTAAAR